MMHSIWHCRLSTFLIHSSSSHSFKNAGHFSAQCTRNMHAQNALCICSADCTLQNPSLVLKTQNITYGRLKQIPYFIQQTYFITKYCFYTIFRESRLQRKVHIIINIIFTSTCAWWRHVVRVTCDTCDKCCDD